ncbi:MAG: hypothetical protein ACP5D6_08335 [Kosmotogaceae bacterium]
MRGKCLIPIILIFLATIILSAPPAGFKIENFASARYRDGDGVHITVHSDKVLTTVLPVYGFTIKPDGTFKNPGQEREGEVGGTVDLDYVVRNYGNSPTTISLTTSQIFEDGPSGMPTLRVIGIYLNEGDENFKQQAETPIDSIDLEIDGSKKIKVRVIIEKAGELTDRGYINIVGEDPVGNIDDNNIALINIEEQEILSSVKSRLLETVMPGTSQSFTISLRNNSEFEIDSVILRDFIDYNGNVIDGILDPTSFVSNQDFSIRYFEGSAWSTDPPQNDEDIKGFELTFSQVNPGMTLEVSFDVFFPRHVSPGKRYNTASLSYSRLGTVWDSETNMVDFNIPAIGMPLLGPYGYPDAPEMTLEDTTVSTVTSYDGDTIVFRHTLKNDGNTPGVMDLLIESANFTFDDWGFVFKNDKGVLLTDTDESGYVDIGVVDPGEHVDIILEVMIPEGVSGDNSEKGFKFIPKTVMNGEENRTIDIIPQIKKSDKLNISKTVLSDTLVLPGAEVRFQLLVKNESENQTGKIVVSDPISPILSAPYDVEFSKEASYSFINEERILLIEFDSLNPLETVEITFKCTADNDLEEGTVIENMATITGKGTIEDSEKVSVKIYHGSLELIKLASPSVVELGSEITYTVEVSNPSTLATVTDLSLEDKIPSGTSYIEGSARVNGEPLEPLIMDDLLVFSDLGNLGPKEKLSVLYSLRLDEFTGESLKNMAKAIGTIISEGYSTEVITEPSIVEVKVVKPMNTSSGIIGRVYIDENENGFYDENDSNPLPLRLLLQDGSFVVTDKDGLFHFDRLEPGLHVVKVDIDVTPYKLSPVQDNRSLRDGRSFLINSMPGMYTIIDIPLIHSDKVDEVIVYDDPKTLKGFDTTSAIVSGNQSFTPSMLSDYCFIVSPLDGQEFTGVDRLMVEVAVPIGSNYSLFVNDIKIPENQIGQKANDAEGQWLFVKYFNVKLIPGNNRIRVEWQNRTEKGSKEIEVYLSGEPFEFKVSTDPQILTADGVTEASINISLVDKQGVPSSVGGTIIIEGLDPHIVSEPAEWNGTRLKLENGVAKLKLKPTVKSQVIDFSVKYGGLLKEIRLEYVVESRPPLITGGAQLQYSFEEGSLYVDGGIFGRLNIDDGLLTFRFGENTSEDFETYITHGDESIKDTLAPSSEWYFMRYEIGLFNVQLGDYTFESRGKIGFLSRGTGLSSEYSGQVFSYRLFVNPVYRGKKVEEFRGEGIRGPYYLSEIPIFGSETISLITRNAEGEIINRKVLERGDDYTIYYSNKLLIFNKPVPYFDLDFNPVFIEVAYSTDSKLPSDLDMMTNITYSPFNWKYTLTGLIRGLSNGYRFASLRTEGRLSESLSHSFGLLTSFDGNVAGFRVGGSLNLMNNLISGNLELHIDKNFKAPENSKTRSGFDFNLELSPRIYKLKLLSRYNFDVKTNTGTLSQELLKEYQIKQVMTEFSLKQTLIHTEDSLENEIRLIARPELLLDRIRMNGELSLGLRGKKPVAGIYLKTDYEFSETVFTAGDLTFDYSGADKLELSTSHYILKRFKNVTLTAKGKINFFPDLGFATLIGLGYTLDTGKLDIETTLSERVSIGAGYTAHYFTEIINLDFLIQGMHTFVGSSTEDFYAFHAGIENRKIESLKLRLDTDLKLDGKLSLQRLLVESKGEYYGSESLKPTYHVLYTNDINVEISRFEVQAGVAYIPSWKRPLAILAEGAYYYNRKGEEITTEGRLTLDIVYWYDRALNFSLTGEIYLKKDLVYAINGLRAEKWIEDLFYISGAGYIVNDNRGGFYNRFILETGFSLWPDTEIYAGYGFGSLKESFFGSLRKDGFYFGARIKFDDSWFFKDSNKGTLNLYFFNDENLDKKFDLDETPVKVKVMIDGKEYESNDNGVISIELPAGLYEVELLESPGSLISLLKENPKLKVTKNGSKSFYWPFMDSPAYIDIRIFIDSNSSGKYDEGERYLKSFSINIGDGVMFTDQGTLTIPVSSESIRISLDLASLGSDVSLTTGSLNRELELRPGERKNVEFGVIFQRKIEVILFKDLNANGLRESEEPLLDASGIFTIGGKPFRINAQTVLEGVPAGVSKASLTMEKGFERIFSRTTDIDSIKVNETGNTLIEIGFAEKSALSIIFLEDNEDYFYDVVTLKINGTEFQAFGTIELAGLTFGKQLVEIVNLPEGYTCDKTEFRIWLEPGSRREIEIIVRKE